MKKRFSILLTVLSDAGWVTTTQADKAEKQYSELIVNKDLLAEAEKFDINNDRVDVFWSKILKSDSTIDLENIEDCSITVSWQRQSRIRFLYKWRYFDS